MSTRSYNFTMCGDFLEGNIELSTVNVVKFSESSVIDDDNDIKDELSMLPQFRKNEKIKCDVEYLRNKIKEVLFDNIYDIKIRYKISNKLDEITLSLYKCMNVSFDYLQEIKDEEFKYLVR